MRGRARNRRRRRAVLVTTIAVLVLLALLPASAYAVGIDLPVVGNPLDLGLPSPTELVGKLFQSFLKTFFGIEAKVTRGAVAWLLATPVYSDSGKYAQLNGVASYVSVAGWALFTLMFAVSAVRYYTSGFTSAGSYEAVEALARSALAAGALAVYPDVFGSLSLAANYLTDGVTHLPAVAPGLTKLLGSVAAANFSQPGIGAIATLVGVVVLILLAVTKIVIVTLLALLYVTAPLAIALWPLPETSWLARTWMQTSIGVLLWPVIWALCFAVFAVLDGSTLGLKGALGSTLVKPWVSVAALFVAFKAPQLVARQAMLAGLAPSLGNTAARMAVYGRATARASGASNAGKGAAERAGPGVSGA
jgi:hypothetical protein